MCYSVPRCSSSSTSMKQLLIKGEKKKKRWGGDQNQQLHLWHHTYCGKTFEGWNHDWDDDGDRVTQTLISQTLQTSFAN